ncbi:sensor histidine kinase [Clostridium neuense]|uniref:histidine kinase n=1 Tax=Clostridium neuense TaxID=1728934 RepID=A0ABW8TLH7_9CLOT
MDRWMWIDSTKLAVLTYCTYEYCSNKIKNIYELVLIVLIYICLNTITHLVKKINLKRVVVVLCIINVIAAVKILSPMFIILIALNILELNFYFKYSIFTSILELILIFIFITPWIKVQFVIFTFFNCVIYMLSNNYSVKVNTIIKENDEMREKIYNLSSKLDKNYEYERQIKYTSKLEERNKIAQEIHDRLGHTIAGSLIQLEASKLFLYKDVKKSEEIINKVTEILRNSNEGIRASLKNIKPPSEQMGINKIKITLDEFSVNSNIKTNLVCTGMMDKITNMQWMVIHDNLKEALTNILKYSKATQVNVKIDVLSKLIRVEIKDNGVGAESIKKSLGIIGMEERCGKLRGQVIVDGTKGFSVIIILPIEE